MLIPLVYTGYFQSQRDYQNQTLFRTTTDLLAFFARKLNSTIDQCHDPQFEFDSDKVVKFCATNLKNVWIFYIRLRFIFIFYISILGKFSRFLSSSLTFPTTCLDPKNSSARERSSERHSGGRHHSPPLSAPPSLGEVKSVMLARRL